MNLYPHSRFRGSSAQLAVSFHIAQEVGQVGSAAGVLALRSTFAGQSAASGADDPSNIVVLCANHHRMFHYADVRLIMRGPNHLAVKLGDKKVVVDLKPEGGLRER